jgi:hypothetical protein
VSPTTLLVTIAIGKRHGARWERYCRPGWERYARRHGYDLHCVSEPLDVSPRAQARSLAWQKCLVLEQPFAEGYERVVWVDADVVINPEAPSVVEGVPVERVGAVDEFAGMPELDPRRLPSRPMDIWDYHGREMARNAPVPDFYASWGLPRGFDEVVQTGVLVLSPRHHRELLRRVYDSYENQKGALLEMGPVSYELLRADLVHWIDKRFNVLWMPYRAQRFPFLLEDPENERAEAAVAEGIGEVHFMHFAAGDPAITQVDPVQPAKPRARGVSALGARHRCATPIVVQRCGGSPDASGLSRAIEEADPPELVKVDSTDADPRLDGVFARFEAAIVLRDDCVVNPGFFRFCDELLERYRDDPAVLTVSGNNFQFRHPAGDGSYYFSRYPHSWGWATWRRAWERFDPAMAEWPALRDSGWLEERFSDIHAVRYWTYLFDQAHGGDGAWDQAWTLACWRAGGLTALPNANLSTKVGSGPDDSRTRAGHRGAYQDMALEALEFPLRHPEAVRRDEAADAFTEDVLFSGHMRRMFDLVRKARR